MIGETGLEQNRQNPRTRCHRCGDTDNAKCDVDAQQFAEQSPECRHLARRVKLRKLGSTGLVQGSGDRPTRDDECRDCSEDAQVFQTMNMCHKILGNFRIQRDQEDADPQKDSQAEQAANLTRSPNRAKNR